MSYFLGSAIALTLVGASIMVLVGAALHRLPALSSPQDITALLLAAGVASMMASNPDTGPTVAALIATVTALTGAANLAASATGRLVGWPLIGKACSPRA